MMCRSASLLLTSRRKGLWNGNSFPVPSGDHQRAA
jgi:hypothetical protein